MARRTFLLLLFLLPAALAGSAAPGPLLPRTTTRTYNTDYALLAGPPVPRLPYVQYPSNLRTAAEVLRHTVRTMARRNATFPPAAPAFPAGLGFACGVCGRADRRGLSADPAAVQLPPPPAMFAPAFTTLQQCYATCGRPQPACDRAFYDRMLAACMAQRPAARDFCRNAANARYAAAAASWGRPAYCRAQDAACACNADIGGAETVVPIPGVRTPRPAPTAAAPEDAAASTSPAAAASPVPTRRPPVTGGLEPPPFGKPPVTGGMDPFPPSLPPRPPVTGGLDQPLRPSGQPVTGGLDEPLPAPAASTAGAEPTSTGAAEPTSTPPAEPPTGDAETPGTGGMEKIPWTKDGVETVPA